MWDALPVGGRLLVFVIPAAIFPLVTTEGNLFRYGLITLLYALLALGLNVVVGFAGLLDLGYIAFFGFGAYMYGILASGHSGRHWPAELAIPVVIAGGALLGLLVGLPSRRLVGDYLAIVTLFFGQAFVVFVNNANRIDFPFIGHTDLTGGANGLDNIDPLNLFGWKVTTTKEYYYFTLGAFVLVMMLLYFVNESRTGRAWRALREDPLAAEVMSIPINRLKLLAFVFGAATAAFAGSDLRLGPDGCVPRRLRHRPADHDLRDRHSGRGGQPRRRHRRRRIIVNGVPELLRDPNQAEWVFYVGLTVVVFARVRPWPRLVGVVAGTIGFGFAVHAIADAVWPRLTAGVLRWRGRARARGRILGAVTRAIRNRSRTWPSCILIAAMLVIDPAPRCVAHGRARADDLPRLLRLGEPPHPADGRRDSFPPARRVAGRSDERSAARPVRNRAGGDRLMAQKLLELRKLNKSFGGLTRDQRPRPARRTRTRS